jgi:hypothetical protein
MKLHSSRSSSLVAVCRSRARLGQDLSRVGGPARRGMCGVLAGRLVAAVADDHVGGEESLVAGAVGVFVVGDHEIPQVGGSATT